MFKDYFDIYVGLVSGLDKIYKNSELGNIIIQNGMQEHLLLHLLDIQQLILMV